MHTSILCQSEDGLVTFHSAMGIVAILFNFGTGWIIVFQAQYSPLTMCLTRCQHVDNTLTIRSQVQVQVFYCQMHRTTESEWALKFLRQDTAHQDSKSTRLNS